MEGLIFCFDSTSSKTCDMYYFSESRAIARHVLRKHKPELLGTGSLEQAAMVDVWLEVEGHQLHPAAIVIVGYCIFASYLSRERNQAAVDENVEKLKKVAEFMPVDAPESPKKQE